MGELLPMDQLPVGGAGKVEDVCLDGAIRRRLQDLGLISGTEIQCVHCSPGGDPAAYLIRGAVIALRRGDTKYITLRLE